NHRLLFGPGRNRRVPHPRHPYPHRRRHPPHPASPPLHPPQAPLLQILPRRRRPPPLPHHPSFLSPPNWRGGAWWGMVHLAGCYVPVSEGGGVQRTCLSYPSGQHASSLCVEHGQGEDVSRLKQRLDLFGGGNAILAGHHWVSNALRKLVILLPFETPAGLRLANSAPLLEEERNTTTLALIPKRQNPF